MAITSITRINNQNLAKSQINLLAKLDSLGVKWDDSMANGSNVIHVNPYTQVQVSLTPLASVLATFILESYRQNQGFGPLTYKGKVVTVQVWDRTRYFFLHFWPKEYYDLID